MHLKNAGKRRDHSTAPVEIAFISLAGFAAMDAIDRKILALLQQDASHSVAEIGSLVGLSSTPCWKRIQRLEADGVIQRRAAPGGLGKDRPGGHAVGLDWSRGHH